MFNVSIGQHISSLVPGVQNIASRGGSAPGVRSKRGLSSGRETLHEAVRTLDRLSDAEKEILSSHSTRVLNSLLGLETSQLNQNQFDWETAFKVAVESVERGSIKLSPDRKSLWFSNSFLSSPSPLLINARGFKTRSTNTDKPFVKNSKDEAKTNEDAFKDVLKQLNISASEKEKVNIALTMAAGTKGKEGAGESSESDKSGSGFKRWKITGGQAAAGSGPWTFLSKMSTVLVIICCLIALFNFGINTGFGIRLTKGANEISPEDIEVNFDDVRGCDEAKKELQDVVEFLMNPDKFGALGGRLPKGVLLVGPPGTGKTLLARAVAGQAGVPFFHSSGSEFDEVLVGQGARRVRDLFKAAKERAPCVIFIDEIDSVGSKRTNSSLHPYANQTINQLLSEMDGFISNEGMYHVIMNH